MTRVVGGVGGAAHVGKMRVHLPVEGAIRGDWDEYASCHLLLHLWGSGSEMVIVENQILGGCV